MVSHIQIVRSCEAEAFHQEEMPLNLLPKCGLQAVAEFQHRNHTQTEGRSKVDHTCSASDVHRSELKMLPCKCTRISNSIFNSQNGRPIYVRPTPIWDRLPDPMPRSWFQFSLHDGDSMGPPENIWSSDISVYRGRVVCTLLTVIDSAG